MADFPSWSRENLVAFAQEYAADRNKMLAASIDQANKHAAVLVVLKALADDYARVCDMFCCKPERSVEYRNAREMLK